MLLVFVIIAFLAIGVGLTWYLLAKDQGKKEPITALWLMVGFGLLAIIISTVAEHYLIPANTLSLVVHKPLGTVLLATLAVGAIEECSKFLPAAFFLYGRSYFRDHVDGVIFFAIVGLAFGIPENILYTAQFGVMTGVGRILMDPIFHATTTAMVGYFLGKSKVDGSPLYQTGLALVSVILIHALYDFGLFSQNLFAVMLSLAITAAMAASLFLFFRRAKALDRQEGLVVVGHNSFCRNCGHANPKHNLFCSQCGQHA